MMLQCFMFEGVLLGVDLKGNQKSRRSVLEIWYCASGSPDWAACMNQYPDLALHVRRMRVCEARLNKSEAAS